MIFSHHVHNLHFHCCSLSANKHSSTIMSSKSMLLQTPMFQSLHTMTTSPSMGSSNFPFPRHLTPRVVAYLAFGILCSYSLFSNLSPRLNSYSANMNPIHNSTLGVCDLILCLSHPLIWHTVPRNVLHHYGRSHRSENIPHRSRQCHRTGLYYPRWRP